MDLVQVGELTEGGLVSQRDIEEAVMSESAHGSDTGRLLTTALGTSGDEKTGIFAPVATGAPDSASLVPESLPLGREVTITSGDTEEDGIVLKELVGFGNGVGGLGRSVHLGQNLIGESLGNSILC